jgi:mannose-6-phosphate isomerase class I
MNKLLCESAMNGFRNLDELKSELERLSATVKLGLDRLETLEDSHYAILFYNYAVYLYLNKQYSKCFKIVDKLYYQFNELLDARLLRHISLIFIELLVQKRQVTL